MSDISDFPAHIPDKDERIRNAAAALAGYCRKILIEFCKDPDKAWPLVETEAALSDLDSGS